MRKLVFFLGALSVLGGLVWLVWIRPAGETGEEPDLETVVAVRVGTITRATLRGRVTAYGEVRPEPPGKRGAAGAAVGPAIPGVITRVACFEGQRIVRGDLMFQLDSRSADVAAEKAQETVAFAEKAYERQKTLLGVEGTSRKLLQEAQQTLDAARVDLDAARTDQALLRILAPLSGTVVRIHVTPGEAVDASTILAEVVDLDRLVVSAEVPTAELPRLEPGQAAEVTADGSAAPTTGTLSYVSPQVDPRTGTAPVRASLPAGSRLRPGQFVTLRIVTQESRDCLVVPVDAVVRNADGTEVIALVEGDRATQTPVRTGLRDAGFVEIEAEGLRAGATVVTEGAYGLPAETRIRVLEE